MADGFKIADAFVEIHADTGSLGSDVSRAVEDAAQEAEPHASSAGSSLGRKFSSSFGDNSKIGEKIDEDLEQGSKGANSFGSAIGGMAGQWQMWVAAAVGGLAVGEQLSGLLALLPAAGFAGAAAIGTLVIGMHGFGQAMKDLDDPKKFAKDLKDLAPAAQQAATAVRDLVPAWKDLQASVQGALFKNIANDIRELGKTYIPVLKTGLTGVADGLNNMVRGFTDFAKEPETVQALSTSLGNVKQMLENLASAVQPFLDGLTTIGQVGSGYLPQFGTWVSNLATKFNDFIQNAAKTGQLKGWIDTGIQAVKDLWAILVNVGTAVKNMLDVFGGGGGLLGALKTLSGVVAWLSPLVPVILGIVAAVKTWSIVQAALNLIMEANPFVLVLTAIIAIAVLVIAHWSEIKAFLGEVWDWIKQTAGEVWEVVKAAWTATINAIASFLSGIWNSIKSTTEAQWNAIKSALTAVWDSAKSAAESTWNGVKNFFSSTWDSIKSTSSSTWNAIKSALTATWDALKSAAESTWNAVKDFFTQLWNNIKSALTSAWNSIKQFLSDTWNAIKQAATAAWDALVQAVKDKANDLMNFIRSLPQSILSALGDLGSLLFNSGKALISGFIDGIKSMASSVASAVSSVMSSARNLMPHSPAKEGPFSGQGWTLYSGQALIQGFAEGVSRQGGALDSALSGVLGPAQDRLSAPAPSLSLVGGTARTRASSSPTGPGRGYSIGELHIHLEQASGSPAETGRMVALALRTAV